MEMQQQQVYSVQGIVPKLLRKGDVLAVAQFPHPSDQFLFLVLIKKYQEDKFVVWVYNAQVDGFGNGSYHGSPENTVDVNRRLAFADFAQQLGAKTR